MFSTYDDVSALESWQRDAYFAYIGCNSCSDAAVTVLNYIQEWGLYEADCVSK